MSYKYIVTFHRGRLRDHAEYEYEGLDVRTFARDKLRELQKKYPREGYDHVQYWLA